MRDEIVLDAFLGSGSTLIAAQRVGRRCYGIDLDPLYVDTVIRRWQALTGGVARYAATGATFDAREEAAASINANSGQDPDTVVPEDQAQTSEAAPNTMSRKGRGR